MTFSPWDAPYDGEETLDDTYGHLWRRLELNPEKVAERGRRREEAERLFEELAQAAPVDLALLLAESGRSAEIGSLSAALESSFPREPALVLAAGALANFGDLAMAGEPRLRQAAKDAAVTLRRTFRSCRLSIKPLLFA